MIKLKTITSVEASIFAGKRGWAGKKFVHAPKSILCSVASSSFVAKYSNLQSIYCSLADALRLGGVGWGMMVVYRKGRLLNNQMRKIEIVSRSSK